MAAINVHASLLPKYRGGAPVHYAIMEGEQETGVTIMEMIKKRTLVEFSASEKLLSQNKMMWGQCLKNLAK